MNKSQEQEKLTKKSKSHVTNRVVFELDLVLAIFLFLRLGQIWYFLGVIFFNLKLDDAAPSMHHQY
jgi:hypothetical protein